MSVEIIDFARFFLGPYSEPSGKGVVSGTFSGYVGKAPGGQSPGRELPSGAAPVTLGSMPPTYRTIPLPQRLMTARIIGASFIFSLFIYGFLIYLIQREPLKSPMPPIDATFRGLLWLFAFLAQPVLAVVASQVKMRRPPADDPEGQSFAAELQTRMILRVAAAESAAIFGLLIFFITREYRDFLMLATFSLALQVNLFPTRDKWETAAREAGYNWSLG